MNQPEITTPAKLERFLRQRQLHEMGLINFSHATLWRKVREGTFPQPVKLSSQITAWRASEVAAWQQAQGFQQRPQIEQMRQAHMAARQAQGVE